MGGGRSVLLGVLTAAAEGSESDRRGLLMLALVVAVVAIIVVVIGVARGGDG